ncbi:MAG: hypothetical protein KBS56_05825 [Clostridiales bacterium]|nr:hypothetical protein [Candidatus Crickella equi]
MTVLRNLYHNVWDAFIEIIRIEAYVLSVTFGVLQFVSSVRFNTLDGPILSVSMFWNIIIASVVGVFIYQLVSLLNCKKKITSKDAFVHIKIGDILDIEKNIVIPINTAFFSAKNGPKEKSIHAQFVRKYYKKPEKLRKELFDAAKKLRSVGTTVIGGKACNTYDRGECVCIGQGKRDVIFVATNDKRAPRYTELELRSTLDNMWKNLCDNGWNNDSLYMPLIGTGKTANTSVQLEDSFMTLVDSYISFLNQNKGVVARHFYIVISQDDLELINLLKMRKYVLLKCEKK